MTKTLTNTEWCAKDRRQKIACAERVEDAARRWHSMYAHRWLRGPATRETSREIGCSLRRFLSAQADTWHWALPPLFVGAEVSDCALRIILEAPIFAHDCDECLFLGRVDGGDAYVCDKQGYRTLLLRDGDSPHEYQSYPIGMLRSSPIPHPWGAALDRVPFVRAP